MELALRAGQEQALISTAQSLTVLIENNVDEKNFSQPNIDSATFYSAYLETPAIIDGYRNDWESDLDNYQNFQDQHISVSAGNYNSRLAIFFGLRDEHIFYSSPQSTNIFVMDALWIQCKALEETTTWLVHAEAPGAINVHQVKFKERTKRFSAYSTAPNYQLTPVKKGEVKGQWQDTLDGFNIEIEIPFEKCSSGIAFVQQDIDHLDNTKTQSSKLKFLSAITSINLADTKDTPLNVIQSTLQDSILNVVTYNKLLEQQLHYLSNLNVELAILNNKGWLISKTNKPISQTSTDSTQSGTESLSFLQNALLTLYLFILQDSHRDEANFYLQGYLYKGKQIDDAKKGKTSTSWSYITQRRAKVHVMHPIQFNDKNTGILIATQKSDAILSLANTAALKLLNTTFLTIFLAALTLIIYASYLSFRIRKLSKTTQSAVGTHGIQLDNFPTKVSNDEIGDLYRNFREILIRVSSYTQYLKHLSSKLSHELRTPLAMVNSSIENLKLENISSSQLVYAERALQGTRRLSTILSAMNEANQVEQSIISSETVKLSLTELLQEYLQAMQSLYPQADIAFELDNENIFINGAPELIAQMMDKLLRNAIDFAQGKTIRIELIRQNKNAVVNVINQGPLLPTNMHEEIFQSMVSIRDKSIDHKQDASEDNDSPPNLGLGLFIVKLVCDFHQGSIMANNLYDDSGVIFTISLPIALHN